MQNQNLGGRGGTAGGRAQILILHLFILFYIFMYLNVLFGFYVNIFAFLLKCVGNPISRVKYSDNSYSFLSCFPVFQVFLCSFLFFQSKKRFYKATLGGLCCKTYQIFLIFSGFFGMFGPFSGFSRSGTVPACPGTDFHHKVKF